MSEPTAPTAPAEAAGLTWLDPAQVQFSRSRGGVLRLTLPDRSHLRVAVLSTQPLSRPDEYLSVRDGDQEIGLLRSLAALPPEPRRLVREELDRRYFRPLIRRVHSILDERGSFRWHVDTDRGEAIFSTQHPRHSVTSIGDGRWMVTDVDRNRYEVGDLDRLDPRSRRRILEILA